MAVNLSGRIVDTKGNGFNGALVCAFDTATDALVATTYSTTVDGVSGVWAFTNLPDATYRINLQYQRRVIDLYPQAEYAGDAESVDGYSAGVGPGQILVLDDDGLVPVGNIPSIGVSGDADTTDGYHAGQGASQLLVLDGQGKVPVGNLGTGVPTTATFLRGDGAWVVPSGNTWLDWTPTVDQGGAVSVTVTSAKYMLNNGTCDLAVRLAITGSGTVANDIIIGGLPAVAAPSAYGDDDPVGVVIFRTGLTRRTGLLVPVTSSTFKIMLDNQTDYLGSAPSLALQDTDVINFKARYPVGIIGGGTPPETTNDIYDDALGTGWSDSSWSATVDYEEAGTVQDGSDSIAVTITGDWGALSIEQSSPVNVTPYTHLRMWFHGGASGGQNLQAFVWVGGNTLTEVPINTYIENGALAAGVWRKCDIPLSALGIESGGPVQRIAVQGAQTGAQPTYYTDSWQWVTIGDGGSDPGLDTTPPTIVSRTPQTDQTNVSVNTSIIIQFSEPMDASTINTSNIELGPVLVAGTVTYDAATYRATFTPNAPLSYNTLYTVALNPGITDVAGNDLTPASWSFRTAVTAPVAGDLFQRTDLIYSVEQYGSAAYWQNSPNDGWDDMPIFKAGTPARLGAAAAAPRMVRFCPNHPFSDGVTVSGLDRNGPSKAEYRGMIASVLTLNNGITMRRNGQAAPQCLPLIKLPPSLSGDGDHFTNGGNPNTWVRADYARWQKEIVEQTILGGGRVFEVFNEPDGYGDSFRPGTFGPEKLPNGSLNLPGGAWGATRIAYEWCMFTPGLRKAAVTAGESNAIFGGPALSNSEQWDANRMETFLTLVKGQTTNPTWYAACAALWTGLGVTVTEEEYKAAIIPDFISMHLYPTGDPNVPDDALLDKIDWANQSVHVNEADCCRVVCDRVSNASYSIMGRRIPVAISEWSFTAATADTRDSDATFQNEFFRRMYQMASAQVPSTEGGTHQRCWLTVRFSWNEAGRGGGDYTNVHNLYTSPPDPADAVPQPAYTSFYNLSNPT